MTTRGLSPTVAAAPLAAALALVAWSLHRALTIDSVPAPAAAARPAAPAAFPGRPALPGSNLANALDRNPFHPERRRPRERFRLPGEGGPAVATSDSIPASSLTLIGTAVLPRGRGFAMCRWGPEAPKLVRIGERIGDMTLKEVKQGRAVFLSSTGERLEVRVPKAGT